MADYKVYFSSLKVFGKVSEIDTKALIKAVTNPITYEEVSQKDIDDFIKESASISRESLENGKYGLMLETMVVNNVVANKKISLAEQKIITTSNFKTDIPVFNTDRAQLKKSKDTIDNVPKPVNEKLDYKLIKEIRLKSNVEINPPETMDAISEFQNNPTEINLNKGILMTSQGLLDGHNELAEDFLDNLINNDSSFIDNNIIYREGNAVRPRIIHGYSLEETNRVTSTYISKIKGFVDGRNNKPRFGGAGAKYDDGAFTGVKSYYEDKLNNTSIKNKALEESAFDSQNQKNKNRRRNNIFIEDMLKAGPNIYTNMFDIYFRFNSSPSHISLGVDEEAESSTEYLFFVPLTVLDTSGRPGTINKSVTRNEYSTFKDIYSLSVRTANVTIPLRNRESSTFKFLNTDIERPSPIVTQNLEGTLSIDCDANAYVNDMFLALSGLQRNGQFRNSQGDLEYINKDFFKRDNNHFPFMAPAKLGYNMNTVDIVVSSHSLSMWSDKSVNPTYGAYYSNIVFVFKDVRFLGVNSGLQFNTENSGTQACEVGFIAKRLETYYKPDNMEFMGYNTNVVRSSIFNAKNRYGTMYDETSVSEKIQPEYDDTGMNG